MQEYFNAHDPAPMYKRQLSPEFEEYIMNYAMGCKKFSSLTFKVNCSDSADEQHIETLLHAIRRHFSVKKSIKEAELKRFKMRSYTLLFVAFGVGVICHGFLGSFLHDQGGWVSGITNSMDVLSWVILWRPIDQLLFQKGGFEQEILVYEKIVHGEVGPIENAKVISIENLKKISEGRI